MVVAKNGRGLLGLATLKSAVYQEWIDGMSLFFVYWYRYREAKVTLIIIGWVWSKMGEVVFIMALLNQVYLTNDMINWINWSNDFCMQIVME